jgi:hypothetical protein
MRSRGNEGKLKRRRNVMMLSGSKGLKLRLLLPRPGMMNSNAESLKLHESIR